MQPTSRANWCRYLDTTPRNELLELPAHDIPDGSDRVDPFDPESERIWADEDSDNILGTPLESEHFIFVYLQRKGCKHCLNLDFIKDVAEAEFPREVEHMFKGASVPCLSHMLKSVQKKTSIGMMDEGYGLGSPRCMVTLPLHLGVFGARIRTGGKGAAHGSLGLADFI